MDDRQKASGDPNYSTSNQNCLTLSRCQPKVTIFGQVERRNS
jgi:hypothetical protein